MSMTLDEVRALRDPREYRALVRSGEYDGPTYDMVPGYTQTGLVVLPKADAFDFLLFCQRNPKPCPLLEVLDPGDPEPRRLAPKADIRTDMGRYRIWRNGEHVEDMRNLLGPWRDDLVAFLLGCSRTFEDALGRAGVRFVPGGDRRTTPYYVTNIECVPAGRFRGPMTVSMRPMTPTMAIRAVQISTRFPDVHGAPIHIGDPAAIGIRDLAHPYNYDGGRLDLKPGDVPVFWACGTTPLQVAIHSRVEFMVTQVPAWMLITDVRSEQLSLL